MLAISGNLAITSNLLMINVLLSFREFTLFTSSLLSFSFVGFYFQSFKSVF